MSVKKLLAISLLATSFALPGFSEEQICDQPTLTTREYYALLNAASLDEKDFQDRLSFSLQVLEDGGSECALRQLALIDQAISLFALERFSEMVDLLGPIFEGDLIKRPEMKSALKYLAEAGAVSGYWSGKADEVESALQGHINVLLSPAPQDAHWIAEFLSVTKGYKLEAVSMASLILDEHLRRASQAERNNSRPSSSDPQSKRRLNAALMSLYNAGEADRFIDYVSRINSADGITNLDLLALSAVPQTSDPASALQKLQVKIDYVKLRDENGYVSPEFGAALAGASVLGYRAAGRIEDSERELRSAKMRFGAEFDPEKALSTELVWMSRPGMSPRITAFEEATLLDPIAPNWPWEVNDRAEASCVAQFNIDEQGKPIRIKVECSDERFEKSATNAIKRARFAPLMIDGKPKVRYGVVQPLDYKL
ncbi:TonB family protein [Hyphomonas neptunium ATCC 15444]|uniref:TonB family protein n=2 Tax=Hyphomonas TaxID=85 RepID=Q0C2B6_HYPNA|nr:MULTISPECIES: energy transducer TonB [Hyphomonas]ABI78493.1 TonB family protein [Hyphomonas neptunium ATCC 15444]